MKHQTNLVVLFTFLLCGFFASELMAQPIGGNYLGPRSWRIPTIVNPQDVVIGSTTSIATNDDYRSFLRFSSPVDIDVRIDGDAAWRKDPQAALFIMNGTSPAQVAEDDDDGPHRDFLIEHRLLANRTYILQVGTRRSNGNTLVTLTTEQIALHGQIESHTPESRSGRLVEANWDHGTDFGPCTVFFGRNERNFTVQNFARNQSSFRIDNVSISPFVDPFSSRPTSVPQEHADSFTASIVNDSEIKVDFRPLAEGVINATMLIQYSYDGRSFEAAVPLIGRGWMFFARGHNEVVSGLGNAVYHTFDYEITWNAIREDGPVWMNLEFDAPVSEVTVAVIPRRYTAAKAIATLYDSRNNYTQGQQLIDEGSYMYATIASGRPSSVNLKVSLPTEEEVHLTEFQVFVIAYR